MQITLKVKSESVSHSAVSNSLRPHGWKPARLLCLWDFPGKNTGVGTHSLLQGIIPTQGYNPGPLHCREILYNLSHYGRPEQMYVMYVYIFLSYYHCILGC